MDEAALIRAAQQRGCLQRDYGAGYGTAECRWTVDSTVVILVGPDLPSVVELAGSAVNHP